MVRPGNTGVGKSAGHPINDAHPKTVRRIVLLGQPGVGKSASGNTILGSDQFESDCRFDPVTAEAVSKSAIVEGRQVTVVDTPGFTDEVLTLEQLFTAIRQSLVKASPGPHAFVFVVRLGRITPADVRMFEHLPKVFDSDVCSALQYSMVLFTHGNGLKGRSIDDLIHSGSKNAKHVSKLVSMCGGRYCVLDNGDKKNREQVRNLLNKIDVMVEANGGQHFTNDRFKMADRVKNEGRNLSAETIQTSEAADGTGLSASDRQLSKFVYDHLYEIFLIAAGLILGGAAGAAIAAKYGCGCKVAVLIGGVVGAAGGTAVAVGGVKVKAKITAKVTAKAKVKVTAEAEAEAIVEAEVEAEFPQDSE